MTTAHMTFDPLYGPMDFSSELAELISTPIVQRLRGIRLSNIDSVAMPGLSGITRYEHSLGTLYVASRTRAAMSLPQTDRLVLHAAALLHDSLIPGLGHLVEEALDYADAKLDHETYWDTLLSRTDPDEIGGAELQIYLGKQSGLEKWAEKHLGPAADHRFGDLISAIRGEGRWGKCISGAMDVDNLDNVIRVAFHLGLRVDPKLPLLIANAATAIDTEGFIFDDTAIAPIREWSRIRTDVYERLMPAAPDFSGKVMVISAVLHAFQAGVFQKAHWKSTDSELISRFLSCGVPAVEEPIKRWLLGDHWHTSPLTWMEGDAPKLPRVKEYSAIVSKALGRQCLAYRIKDKRHRVIAIKTTSGAQQSIGSRSDLWLLGVASPKKAQFTAKDNALVIDAAKDFFGSRPATVRPASRDAPMSLF